MSPWGSGNLLEVTDKGPLRQNCVSLLEGSCCFQVLWFGENSYGAGSSGTSRQICTKKSTLKNLIFKMDWVI